MTERRQATLLPEGNEPTSTPRDRRLADGGVEAPEPGVLTGAEMRDTGAAAESPALAALLAQFKRLAAPLTEIAAIKPSTTDAAERIEQALGRLPPGATIGSVLDELRGKIEGALMEQRRAHSEGFRRHEAAFIRAARDAGTVLREQNEGWRVGPIEFAFRRGAAQACALYNHEEIVRWTVVRDVSDLEKIQQQGRAMLDRAHVSLPDDLLIAVIWDAYAHARVARAAARIPSPDTVPVLDFYRELRIALVRHDLEGKRPEAKLAHAEMPKWAFLHTLDRYRDLGAAVPPERRLGFQTGSQAESMRGRCVTLNGLDAAQQYKEFCYVLPPRAAAP